MSSHVTGREKTARCAHLLVKHTESRNPVSRRTGEQITMSKDHARRYLEGLLEGIKAAPEVAQIARLPIRTAVTSRRAQLAEGRLTIGRRFNTFQQAL